MQDEAKHAMGPAAPGGSEQQLSLPGAAEQFAAAGLTELPIGARDLNKRQLTFCLEFLRTGNAFRAAAAAGYGDPASDGSRVQRSPAVAAFLARAVAPVAKNVDQLVVRVWERSQALHARWRDEMAKPESLRSQATLSKLLADVNRTDSLLGSLVGKIQGIHLTGELNHAVGGTVQHNHTVAAVPVPADALPALAQMRREVILHRRGEGMPPTPNAN